MGTMNRGRLNRQQFVLGRADSGHCKARVCELLFCFFEGEGGHGDKKEKENVRHSSTTRGP